jgi:hypothetical protein
MARRPTHLLDRPHDQAADQDRGHRAGAQAQRDAHDHRADQSFVEFGAELEHGFGRGDGLGAPGPIGARLRSVSATVTTLMTSVTNSR